MRRTLTFLDTQYSALTAHLFGHPEGFERAAYLLCGLSQTERELRLLVRQVVLVADADLLDQSATYLTVPAKSFLPVLKRAEREQGVFVFVHSHPKEIPDHSRQDDHEEAGLFRTAYNRITTPNAAHASLVLSDPAQPRGRIWQRGGTTEPIDLIRVIGRRFHFYPRQGFDQNIDTSLHDREVRAFGPDILPLLQSLTIGVAGAGGTGSAVIEQLIRLGVGRLIVADGQELERSNISRVYGSEVDDVGLDKVALVSRLVRHIGLPTKVEVINQPITYASVLKRFRDCDVVFGCTDDQWGRAALTQFSIEYCIPGFDLGVKIDSKDGRIRSIPARVTTLMPGLPCLFCRNQITSQGVADQSLEELVPAEAARQRKEGYIPELPGADPAVIAFTTACATLAVGELLQRLTGYKGENYNLGELVMQIDQTAIRKPGAIRQPGCICTKPELIGRGDQLRFLDQTWRPE
jgi:molybdopterin/thiamine biosynthesis adenylyltransferase